MVEMVETVETVETAAIMETVEMVEMVETVETAVMEVMVETVETPHPETSLAFLLQSHTLPHLKVQASLPMKEALQASRSHWERWVSFYFRTLFDWKPSL